MQTICISLGGSIVSKEKGVDVGFIERFGEMIKKDKTHKFIIIVGGGYVNRTYLNQVREAVQDDTLLDAMGIYFTRINAMTVKGIFERENMDVHSSIVRDLETLALVNKVHKIVLMGGLIPGITTDCVGIMAAEATRAGTLINMSNVDHVYDKDPRAHKDAKPFGKMSYDQLISLAAEADSRQAKANFIFDLVACKLAKRSHVKVKFVKEDIKQLQAAINGDNFGGTVVG